MCEPATIMGVVAVVTAATSIAKTAMDAKAANQKASDETAAANQALVLDQQAVLNQQDQANQSAALEKTERLRLAMRERAALRSSSAEGGVSGATPTQLEGDTYQASSYDIGVLEANRQNYMKQTELEKVSIRNRAQSRLNEAAAGRKSGLYTGLQIGGQVLSGAMGVAGAVKGGGGGGDAGQWEYGSGSFGDPGAGVSDFSTGEF